MAKFLEKIIEKRTEALAVNAGYECNNFCIFCMQADRAKRFQKLKEAPEKKMYRLLENNGEMEKVIFTGAEPTLNPKLLDYVRRAKELGYKRIELITNGRMLSYKDYCAKLIEAGVGEFIVSIHGHNKAVHEAITRSPGSFEQASRGLANLSWFRKRRPIKLSVNHVLIESNFRFAGDFLKFLKNFFLDNAVLKVVSNMRESAGEESSSMLVPRYGEVVKILDRSYRNEHELFLSRLNPGRNYVYIYDLPFCCYKTIRPFFGVRENTFLETDDKIIPINHSRNKIQGEKCISCKHRTICSGIYKSYIDKYGWDEFTPVIK